ncbi:hypothetical protein F0Q45_16170 [Mycobacterium simiae]|uniref:Uncharacterized protein n=1 Tax=Mycobacterium simiae TaxID=1784 RepID=A0A5B1BNA1_MYCSI|nr:hypothetical protein F0Q45_16170 [Mycobacterium simiae]
MAGSVMCAAPPPRKPVVPPHRFALHRRRPKSCAPLLSPASGWCPHTASRCIVAGQSHVRRSSPPQAGGAPTPLRCIVAGASHARRSSWNQ